MAVPRQADLVWRRSWEFYILLQRQAEVSHTGQSLSTYMSKVTRPNSVTSHRPSIFNPLHYHFLKHQIIWKAWVVSCFCLLAFFSLSRCFSLLLCQVMSSGSVPLLMSPGLQCVHSVFIHPMMAFIQYIIGTHESISVNLLIVKLQREYSCCFYSIISYTVLFFFFPHNSTSSSHSVKTINQEPNW